MASILEIILKAVKQGSGFKDTERDTASLSKAVGGLNKILGMAGLAIGTKELFDFSNASRIASREQKDAIGTLEAASEGIADYGQAMELAKQQTKGMTSETKLASSMATLFSAGIATNAQEAAQLAQAGSVLSGVFAAAGGSMETFVKVLSTGSIELFNNVGLTQAQVRAYQAEVEATTGLTGEAARLQAIKLALIDNSKKYAGAMSDETIAAQQAQAAQENFTAAFGNLINEMDRATGATGLTTWFLNLETEGAKAWGTVFEGVAALSAQSRAAAEATGSLDAYRMAMGGITQAQIDAEHAAADAAAAQEDVASAEADAAAAAAAELAALGPLNSSLLASGQAAQGATAGELALARGMTAARQAAIDETQAIKDLAASRQENLQAMSQESAARQDLLSAKEAAPELGTRITEQRKAVFDIQQQQEEEAARDSERTMRESNRAIVDSVSELGNQIASAVSGAISGVNQDVIGQLLGIEGAEANAGEAVRRMAAVAAGGIQNEWAPALAQQLTGVQDATAQAFVQAFQAGDSGALQGAARQLALNPIVDMFDANLIAQQVEQKLRAQQLTQQLNDKVNALLGEKGLPAVASVSQQVGQAATDTGIATGLVQQSTTDMAASAEAAGAKMKTSFDGTITQINIAISRLQEAIGLTERWGVVAGQTAGRFNALNPPAANGNGVPNEAQRRMGPLGPL